MTEIPELGTTKFTDLLLGFTTAEDLETLIITVLSHPGGTAKAIYGEATNFEAPRDGRRGTVRPTGNFGPSFPCCCLLLQDLRVFPFIVNKALAFRRGVPSSPRWLLNGWGLYPSLAPHHP
jgi:hypothetical protein